MVTARTAGFSPGTSPPPVRIPITPFWVAMWAILHLIALRRLRSTAPTCCSVEAAINHRYGQPGTNSDWFRAGLAADSRIRAPALYEWDGQTEKKVTR